MKIPDFDLTYNQLPQHLYADAEADVVIDAQYVWVNDDLADEVGLGREWLNSATGLEFLAGKLDGLGHVPLAMAYSGHQFGHLSPQLGDGRAMLIGEFLNVEGVRYDLGLKGTGRTVYARGGDGKSTLRAALKEVIFSEYLAAIGIPTSRAVAAYSTGETVMREEPHKGAVLARMAKSFIRVGTFQYARLMPEDDAVRKLADFLMAREFADIDVGSDDKYQQLLGQTIARQAYLIAKWMSQGFIHGVMNTDNMALAGETIDFGPCAFMEVYKADQVYSSIDKNGRYAWNKQAEIAVWNLARLAETLLPLFNVEQEEAIKIAEAELNGFMPLFFEHFGKMMMVKLGLSLEGDAARDMTNLTFAMLANAKVDYTLFFRRLSEVLTSDNDDVVLNLCEDISGVKEWLGVWQRHIAAEDLEKDQIAKNMNLVNPIYVPRLHLVEQALGAAGQGDLADFEKLFEALNAPFNENPEFAEFTKLADDGVVEKTFCET